MGPEQRVGLGRSKARYQPATNFPAAWHGVFKKLIQEHLSPCTRTEPAGADARMIIKQAVSGIPVFLLLFSLNRIQDRGPFTRSRSHALKSPGHSAATAVGPNLSADYYSNNQLIGPAMVRHCLAQSRHALAQSSIPSSLSQLSAHASQISAHILQT